MVWWPGDVGRFQEAVCAGPGAVQKREPSVRPHPRERGEGSWVSWSAAVSWERRV